MKVLLLKGYSTMATFARTITGLNVNVACSYWVHQPELPEAAKKLRKF